MTAVVFGLNALKKNVAVVAVTEGGLMVLGLMVGGLLPFHGHHENVTGVV